MANGLLPVYFVIDTSKSMQRADKNGNTAYRAAADMCKAIYTYMLGEPDLCDRLIMEIIFFDNTARTTFELDSTEEVESWYPRYKNYMPVGTRTLYSEAFAFLKTRIDIGVNKIKMMREGGAEFRPYRPLVIFITDGRPTEQESNIRISFEKLTAESNPCRPNILCIGVGEADADLLLNYSAGKVSGVQNAGRYIYKNKDLMFVPKNAESAAEAIVRLTEPLIHTIVNTIPGNEGSILSHDGIIDVSVPVGWMQNVY